MKRPWVALAVGLQLLVVVWMAAEREWIVATGERVWLQTAPVDPRDIFRGDYVELDYAVSLIDLPRQSPDLRANAPQRGDLVYLLLSDTGGLVEGTTLQREKPPQGLFLRGRIQRNWRIANPHTLSVKFGIEQLFLEQGKGLEMEKRRGRRNELQTPLEVEVAIGTSGKAVLVGHRWSRLGMQLVAETGPIENPAGDDGSPQPNDNATDTADNATLGFAQPGTEADGQEPGESSQPRGTDAPRVTLILENVSDAPLDLALLPDDCSFQIRATRTSPQPLDLTSDRCAPLLGEQPELLTLEPGERFERRWDFNEPRWQLEWAGKAGFMDALPFNQRFRIHYQPPVLDSDQFPRVWRGRLSSSAFNGQARID